MIKDKKFQVLIYFILLMVFPHLLAGQPSQMGDKLFSKAMMAYTKRDFDRTIKLAGRISSKDDAYIKSRLLLADVYHEMDSLAAELKCLETVAGVDNNPLIYYRLGECYYKTGTYDKGYAALIKYIETGSDRNLVSKATRLIEGCRFSIEAVKTPIAFQPENLGNNVNSDWDDYWPSLTVDGKTLIFTRLIPADGKSSWKQEDFFESKYDSTGWQPAFPLSDLNTPANEGAQSISADGKLLFFTLCNHPDGMGSCDIFFSRLTNGKWSKPLNAGRGLNTQGWEGQPSFSAFDNILYFSSGRENGKGARDLWKVRLTGWGIDGMPLWSNVTNLGDSINTPGNEISPFIHSNGRDLYFSSDFRPGLGGYDLFHSHHSPSRIWNEARNLGYPVNSQGNEQGLIIDRSGEKAYFSSNRVLSGNMDIFSFILDKKIRPEAASYIQGEVIDKKTGRPIQSVVHLSWIDADNPAEQVIPTDESGIFQVVLPLKDSLSLTVNKKGFLFYSENFILSDPSSALHPIIRKIYLSPLESGSFVDIYNIYFDTDAFTLLPASLPGLRNLMAILSDNPSLHVEIQGHTDNTGSDGHNLQLSEKRAKAVIDFLIEKGIPASGISAKGYGSGKPVAPNDTEEGRSKNRRTTILIL